MEKWHCSTVASHQEVPWFEPGLTEGLSVWGWHLLLVSAGVFSKLSHSPPTCFSQLETSHFFRVNSKCESEWCVCSGMDWRHVQGVFSAFTPCARGSGLQQSPITPLGTKLVSQSTVLGFCIQVTRPTMKGTGTL